MKVYTVLFCSAFIVSVSADLHNKVRHFETLQSADLNVVSRRKRSVDGRESDTKQISFRALGRKFNLVLYPGSPVLGPNFKAKTVDSSGNTHTFHVNPNNFYTGHLADDSSVSVDAHFEDGVLSSNIRFPHDTYVVEPAWRHHVDSDNFSMITYRGSDVNWEEIFPIDPKTGKRTKMKDGIRLFDEPKQEKTGRLYRNISSPVGHSRHKRAIRKNTCPLLVVADYQFFRDMGQSKRETTASFLIAAVQNVNQHYKNTAWDATSGYVNMGFQIEEMLIHTQYTVNTKGHYNSDTSWDYNQKLYAFSRSRHINKFCLAHLFTSYAFQDNVLGLAFIAPESAASAGGICSISSHIEGAPVYPRTGWSSAKNSRNLPVLSLQYELVTTHGHNWGSEHDPDTDECGPSSRDDGKYVMWPYAVPGFEDNNKFFSPCSKRYIAPVLRSKSGFCFRGEADLKGMCGNGIVEKGEECDVGFTEEGEEDLCCTKKCKLKPEAVCSDFNHACCQGCLVANKTVLCEAKNPLACKDEAFCEGKCYNGTCLNYCALLGVERGRIMSPCLCVQNATAMCRRCCAEVGPDRKKGECLPTEEVQTPGRTCHMGSCDDNGVCVKVEQQLAHRIFRFIKSLTVSKLVEVMRTNIVGTVIILSLLIWIPASWVVSCVDKRKIVQEEDYLQRWVSREHSILGVSREDLPNFRIKNSRFKRLPPSLSHSQGHGNNFHQRAPAPPSINVDPSMMETIEEEQAEKDTDMTRQQLERAAADRQEDGQRREGAWPGGGGVMIDRSRYSDGVYYAGVMPGDEARMDSMDSADSIDLSATPGSVSEEEGRTVANV
ncbi:hypothetical protein ACOMHN_005271 [Nucella lapillus]